MRLRLFGIALLASAACAGAAQPVFPPFGFDLSARDMKVRPGDDFFEYADGAYLARTPIPADQSTTGRRYEMSLRTEMQLHDILDAAAANAGPAPTDPKGKVGTFYAAFMDEGMAEAKGAAPLSPELDAIRKAPDRQALASLMGRYDFYPSPFGYSIDSDLKDPSVYSVYLGQSGLGLPDRDYYLKPDFTAQRTAYRTYAATLLRLIGWPDAEAAADAAIGFETAIARAS